MKLAFYYVLKIRNPRHGLLVMSQICSSKQFAKHALHQEITQYWFSFDSENRFLKPKFLEESAKSILQTM